jgi:hypothetical protein
LDDLGGKFDSLLGDGIGTGNNHGEDSHWANTDGSHGNGCFAFAFTIK